MRGSQKRRAPQELNNWIEGERRAGVPPRYRSWPAALRELIVTLLFGEQTGQCVYCGRAVMLERHERYHVEHFRPRSRYSDLEVEYSNLFLSCGPRKEGEGARGTCGNRKEDWFEEDCHIDPAGEACCERFFYGSSGKILPDETPEARKMIEVLNLNDKELIRERSELGAACKTLIDSERRKNT